MGQSWSYCTTALAFSKTILCFLSARVACVLHIVYELDAANKGKAEK